MALKNALIPPMNNPSKIPYAGVIYPAHCGLNITTNANTNPPIAPAIIKVVAVLVLPSA